MVGFGMVWYGIWGKPCTIPSDSYGVLEDWRIDTKSHDLWYMGRSKTLKNKLYHRVSRGVDMPR